MPIKPRNLTRIFGALTVCASLLLTTGHANAATLRTNIDADAATLNPIQNHELISGNIISNIYETLTALDADGNVIPGLATNWEATANGPGFKFTLREGVTFHSGRTMTSADVKWTFEQVLTPEQKGGLMVDSLDKIVGAQEMLDGKATELAGFEIIDDLNFVVHFVSPVVVFPLYELFVIDRKIAETNGPDWNQSVSGGTGPFKFANWERGVAVNLDTHDGYWKGASAIDGVSFIVVPSAETAQSMFEAGELDLVSVPRSGVRNVVRDPRFDGKLLQKAAAQVGYLGMNQTLYAPFQDARVRQALSLSINRDAMVAGLYGGAAFPSYAMITPGFPGFDDSVPPLAYDPEKATSLMAEAGYPNGEGLPPVTIQGMARDKALLAYYADTFKKTLGMDVSVAILERGAHIGSLKAGTVAFFPWGWGADYADPATYLKDLFYSKSFWNWSHYANPAYDALIEKALATPDNEARFALYNQADRVLVNEFGTIPTTVRMQIGIVRDGVENVHLTAMGYLPFWDVTIK